MSGVFNYPFLCLAFGLGFYSLFALPLPNGTSVPVSQAALTDVSEKTQPSIDMLELEAFFQHKARKWVPAQLRATVPAISKAVLNEGKAYDIDPFILMSVIYIESRFNSKAVGRYGEIGLMQIKPSTALWMLSRGLIEFDSKAHTEDSIARALYDPATNIKFGAAYLAYMRSYFPESETLYLAAYNMGVGNVQALLRRGLQPKRYTDLVFTAYASLQKAYAAHQNGIQTTASTFDLR